MIIDIHTHIFAAGWIPRTFYHGVARFITHEFAKHGVHESPEEIGDSLMETTSDPEGEMLLAEMDEAGIDRSVIFPVDFGMALGDPAVTIEEVNKKIAALARRHPDRFTAFASVDPRRPNAVELFQRCVEQWDMHGLKLHPCAGFYPNQQEVHPLLAKAFEWKLPVIIHSGSMMVPLRAKYSQPVYFDDLGVDFPDLPIIAAHAGGSFGYPQMLSIMGTKLNIMVDISAWQMTALRNYPLFCRALRDMLDFAEPERILFGSDSPSFRSMMSNRDWVQLIRDLPANAPPGLAFKQEEVAAILGGNARRLLGLS